MMDPDVLYDLLNSVSNNTATSATKLVITADTDASDVKDYILDYSQTAHDYDLLTVVTILSKVSSYKKASISKFYSNFILRFFLTYFDCHGDHAAGDVHSPVVHNYCSTKDMRVA